MKRVLALSLIVTLAWNQFALAVNPTSSNTSLAQKIAAKKFQILLNEKYGNDTNKLIEDAINDAGKLETQLDKISEESFTKSKNQLISRLNKAPAKLAEETVNGMTSAELSEVASSLDEESMLLNSGDVKSQAVYELTSAFGVTMKQAVFTLKETTKADAIYATKQIKEKLKQKNWLLDSSTTAEKMKTLMWVCFGLAILSAVVGFVGLIGWGIGVGTMDIAVASAGTIAMGIGFAGMVLFSILGIVFGVLKGVKEKEQRQNFINTTNCSGANVTLEDGTVASAGENPNCKNNGTNIPYPTENTPSFQPTTTEE